MQRRPVFGESGNRSDGFMGDDGARAALMLLVPPGGKSGAVGAARLGTEARPAGSP